MKTYSVKFWGGGGGWFVQQMIAWCETQTNERDSYPQGHAHNTGIWFTQNFANMQGPAEQRRTREGSLVDFVVVDAMDLEQVERMYQRDPDNWRMISIMSDSIADVCLHEYNHFYKNQIYGTDDYGWWPHYQRLYGATEPPEWNRLTTEQAEQCLEALTLERWASPDSLDLKQSRYHQRLDAMGVPYTEINIKQVMSAGDDFLNTISNLVGKPITNAMRHNAREYRQGQTALRSRFPTYNNLISRHPEWRGES